MLFSRIGQWTRGMAAHITNLTASEEPSLFEELWTYIVEKYFTMHWEEYQYQYISINENGLFSVQGFVVAIVFGVIIAAGIAMFQKGTLGDLVRAISRDNCTSVETAKTLAELGLLRNVAVKNALRRGTSLKRFVRCVEEERYSVSLAEKRNALEEAAAQGDETAQTTLKKWKDISYSHHFDTDHFYIPENLIYHAELHFEKKGSNPLIFVAIVVLGIILIAAICFFLPELLQMTDNMLKQILS